MTDEAKALVERLREKIADTLLAGLPYNRDGREAADLIEAQAREIERLREALEPFAFRNLGDDDVIFLQYPSVIVRCEVTYGDVQLARAALGESHD
jgi:hypothetical protein